MAVKAECGKMKMLGRVIGLIVVLAVAAALGGGPASAASHAVWTPGDADSVGRVAFLPFVRVAPADSGKIAVCPVDRRSHDACPIDQAAEAELSRALGRVLSGGAWASQREINAARDRVKKRGGQTLAPSGPLQLAIGRELRADAVLFGFVYCYRNRSGAALASGKPASIGFSLHMVDVRTKKPIWSMSYQDEQKALFANLLDLPLFIKRKGKWITASEMAAESAKVVKENLPWNKVEKKKKSFWKGDRS